MDDRRVSKLLSLVLRHDPGRVGIELDAGGWALVERLLAALAEHGVRMTRADLQRLVRESDKQRFSLDTDRDRIRANQGHSVEVDLDLRPQAPPVRLFHGTPERNVATILRDGIARRGRHAVHLSADVDTATRVGARRGRPVVLEVDAAGMHRDGHVFTRSANGVWLTESVPAGYVRILEPV